MVSAVEDAGDAQFALLRLFEDTILTARGDTLEQLLHDIARRQGAACTPSYEAYQYVMQEMFRALGIATSHRVIHYDGLSDMHDICGQPVPRLFFQEGQAMTLYNLAGFAARGTSRRFAAQADGGDSTNSYLRALSAIYGNDVLLKNVPIAGKVLASSWKGRGTGQLAYVPLDLFYNVALPVARWVFSLPADSLAAVDKLRATVNSAAFRGAFASAMNAYGQSCFGAAIMQKTQFYRVFSDVFDFWLWKYAVALVNVRLERAVRQFKAANASTLSATLTSSAPKDMSTHNALNAKCTPK